MELQLLKVYCFYRHKISKQLGCVNLEDASAQTKKLLVLLKQLSAYPSNQNQNTMEKVSKASAMLHAKCPRCRQGNLFNHSMYGFHIQKMHETCTYCGFLFEQEPGYFYVSMYASYALNVAEIVATVIAVYIFTGNTTSPWLYIGIIFAVSFLLSPFNFRYSRVMLLYWLTPKQVKYQPDIKPVAQGNKTSNDPKLN